MAKDHYVPAALLGMFSEVGEGSRRRRPVAVLRWGSGRARTDVPERIAHKEGLYDAAFPVWGASGLESDRVVDRAWDTYESRLAGLLEALVRQEPIAAIEWLSVLVPWVASMFVRDQGFAERFESRMGGLFAEWHDHESNTNSARLLEMHYLLAPVAAATWAVAHAPDGTSFITNDLGLSPATGIDQEGRTLVGWTIPISSSAALGIFITPTRSVMSAVGGTWLANIQHRDAAPTEVQSCNELAAAACNRLILGASEELVERYVPSIAAERPGFAGDPSVDVMDGWFVIPTANRRAHQDDWRHLVTVASNPPVPGACFELDIFDVAAISASGWKAPLMVLLNREDRWSGLDVIEGPPLSIQLDLLIGHHADRKRQFYEQLVPGLGVPVSEGDDETFQPRGFMIPPVEFQSGTHDA